MDACCIRNVSFELRVAWEYVRCLMKVIQDINVLLLLLFETFKKCMEIKSKIK